MPAQVVADTFSSKRPPAAELEVAAKTVARAALVPQESDMSRAAKLLKEIQKPKGNLEHAAHELISLSLASREAREYVAENAEAVKSAYLAQFEKSGKQNSWHLNSQLLLDLIFTAGAYTQSKTAANALAGITDYAMALPENERRTIIAQFMSSHWMNREEDHPVDRWIGSNYAMFRDFLACEIRRGGVFPLLSIGLNGGSETAGNDVVRHIFKNDAMLENYAYYIGKEISETPGHSLLRQFIKSAADLIYLQSEKPLSAGKSADTDTRIFHGVLACVEKNPETVDWMLGHGSEKLAALAVECIAKLDSRKGERIVDGAFAGAVEGDSRQCRLAAAFMLHGFEPKIGLVRKNFGKLIELAKNEDGWLFAEMASLYFSQFDWKEYKKAFKLMNGLYERGDTDGLARVMGVGMTNIYAIATAVAHDVPAPDELSLRQKIRMAGDLLLGSGIVNRMFGSVPALVSLADGNFPVKSTLNLIKEDRKAREFALMCLSSAVEYTSTSQRYRNEDGRGSVVVFEQALDETLEKMGKRELNELRKVIEDPAIRKEALSNPKTKAGAQYLIDIWEGRQKLGLVGAE